MDFHIQFVIHLLRGDMRIYINILGGKTISLTVNESDSVEIVKLKIFELEGIPPYDQIFIFDWKKLKTVLVCWTII